MTHAWTLQRKHAVTWVLQRQKIQVTYATALVVEKEKPLVKTQTIIPQDVMSQSVKWLSLLISRSEYMSTHMIRSRCTKNRPFRLGTCCLIKTFAFIGEGWESQTTKRQINHHWAYENTIVHWPLVVYCCIVDSVVTCWTLWQLF
jgi:hypothetical protein